MKKTTWKGGTLLAPVPPVMVTCGDESQNNIITIAWTGIINSDPPKTYISVRPERYSYRLIQEKKEFCINIPTSDMVWEVDYCGIKTGATVNKFEKTKLSMAQSVVISTPQIEQCPVVLECMVCDCLHLGSHDMFIADIVSVSIASQFIDDKGKFHLDKANLMAYSHGEYFALGRKLGRFGFSVSKNTKRK